MVCKSCHGEGLVVQFVRTSGRGCLTMPSGVALGDIIGSKSSQCARLRPYTATRIYPEAICDRSKQLLV